MIWMILLLFFMCFCGNYWKGKFVFSIFGEFIDLMVLILFIVFRKRDFLFFFIYLVWLLRSIYNIF